MSARATKLQMRWIGPIIGTAGLYFVLVGLGLLPLPGGPKNLHAPLWVLMLVGLAFFLAGASMLIQVAGQANENGELPSGSPLWLRVMQYLMGVAIFATFAMIGSWIGFGEGPREFSGGLPFVSKEVNEAIGRFAFGAGGVLCWLGALAFAVSGARKLYRRGKT
jgi:hypothetical protein